jgi:hypothetical protein
MKKAPAKMVPKKFTNDQLQRRKEIYADRMEQIEENDEWLYRIIAWDKSCVFPEKKGAECAVDMTRHPAASKQGFQESVYLYL